MKPYRFLLICVALCLSSVTKNLAQEYPYYVVTGSFANETNASRFVAHMHDLNYPARSVYNDKRGLHYVFVSAETEESRAKDIAYRLRKEGLFKDAWIYHGALGLLDSHPAKSALASAEPVDQGTEPVPPTTSETAITPEPESEPRLEDVTPEPELPRHPFLFSLINKETGQPVKGKIIITESENDPGAFQYIDANETVQIAVPKNERGSLVLICELIGYKFQKRAINYSSLVKNNTTGSQITVPIKLAPFKRGDYIDLKRVYFYDSSAVLKPESKDELNELVHLMGNPNYKICLHGHSSTDEEQRLTLPDEQDLFKLNSENKVSSDGKLRSRYRVEAVKKFLVDNGVSEKRVQTKYWGAKLAVFDEAKANNRIEIEILKD